MDHELQVLSSPVRRDYVMKFEKNNPILNIEEMFYYKC